MGAGPADAVRLVGQGHMQGVLVGRAEDGDGLDAHLFARADDAHGYLAAVGYENLAEHLVYLSSCAQVRHHRSRGLLRPSWA